jgi:protoporphyrinogen oxidase
VSVTVLERQHRFGGRVTTERHGHYLIDTGPDALTTSYRHYLALMDELGLADQVVESSQVVGVVRNGRIIDVDPARPWTLPLSGILSFRAKLQLLAGFLRLRSQIRAVDAYNLVQSADMDDPNSTAWDLSRRYFGSEVTDHLVDGIMRLVSASGGRGISRLSLLGALAAWAAPVMNVRGGLEVLPAKLASGLDIRYGAEATGVVETPAGVQVTYTKEDGSQEILDSDACVISAMYDVASAIWPPLAEYAPVSTEHPGVVGLISLTLGYRVPTKTRAYIVPVATAESSDAMLVFMQHNKAPDRAPQGHSLVTMYTDAKVADRYLAMSDAEIEAWGAGIIETWCPELAGQRDLAVVSRWPQTVYLAAPGFWRWSRGLLDSLPADTRVHLAGDLFGAGSMESSVAWGERAAARVIAQLNTVASQSVRA